MFDKFKGIVNNVIEQVVWAERELRGKSGTEKKAIVVKKIDDLIVLPAALEWVDDILINHLVDLACNMFNSIDEKFEDTQHD